MLRLVSTYFGFSNGTDAPSPDGSRRSTSWRVLSNRAFRWYFTGSVVSDLGTWLANTAQLLLAYRLSHSVLVIGLVTCAQFTSPLVLGPFAGMMTDRCGGRQVLFATQVLGAAFAMTMAVLAFAGPMNTWLLTAGAVASGMAFTLALPARNVTVRCLVPEKDVEPAFGMDSVSYNLGRTVGPAGTVALAMLSGNGTIGYGWAFGANGISFLVFAGCLVLAGKGNPELARGPRRSGFKAGFDAAFADWRIAALLAMVAAVTIADDPVLVLGPTLARQQHTFSDLPGWLSQWLSPAYLPGLFLAALGAGTVLGSLRPSRHRADLRVPAVALSLLAACMITFVVSRWWPLSLLAAAGAGFTCLVANSSTRTLLSKRAGPAREASVMAVWAIAWAGSKPIASLADGTLADWLGPRWAGVILALPALIPVTVMLVLMACVYASRRQKPRPFLQPVPASGHRPAEAGARKPVTPLVVWVESSSLDAFRRASELLGTPEAARPEPAPDCTGPQPAISL